MARKKAHEEHENHERWLVSYADFITLLFAFFVVMYSISSVNEGKYRVLSDSLMAAFRSAPRSLEPIQAGQPVRAPGADRLASLAEIPRPMDYRPPVIDIPRYTQTPLEVSSYSGEGGRDMDEAAGQLDVLGDEVEESLRSLIDEGIITVRRNRLWLEVEINTSILFPLASARPSLDAEIVMKKLAELMAGYPNRIHVEGFTDNLPINTEVYPSNWELSSARAAAVVRLFAQYDIAPHRMAAVGYGEFNPIADNRTSAGRARNRRVVIVIIANTASGREAGRRFSEFDVLSRRSEIPPEQEGSAVDRL